MFTFNSTGGRTSNEIVSWLEKKYARASGMKTLESAAEVTALTEEKDASVVVVGLFKNVESASAKAFLEAYEIFEDLDFVSSKESAVFKALGVDKESDSVVVLTQFENEKDKKAIFEGPFE